jgi:hypothetical protein
MAVLRTSYQHVDVLQRILSQLRIEHPLGIESLGSRAAYQDMCDFIDGLWNCRYRCCASVTATASPPRRCSKCSD